MIFGTSGSDSSSILPKTMLIEGAPGTGKTVVAREITSRWAQNKMLPNIKLLLLIYLKQTDINQIKNFEELMQVCYENKDLASSFAKYFVNTQGKNLMIIFDGYDEIATKELMKYDDSFFIKLLKRISLPECYLVVTSRPYITAHLHQYCDCRVEIMGFTNHGRLSYLKENLSVEKFQIVTEFLQKNLIIDSLYYIPLHLINFLSLVEYDTQLPKTQTELIGNTIRLTIAWNKNKKSRKWSVPEIDNIIASIAGFAYIMLDKEQFVFSEEEMKSAGVNMEGNNDVYGLLKAVQLNDVENVQHKKVYTFVHISVQEYLAAYHLSKMYNIAQSFALKYKFWDGKYFGVWKMYVGLTAGNMFPLKQFLSRESYVAASIRHLFIIKFPGIAEELKINKVICLQLYQIFLEAPDSEIKESLNTVIKTDAINLSGENLSITDMNIISYVILRSHITVEWQTIDLSHCNIDDESLFPLCQLSNLEDGRLKPIIKCLNISNNNICKLSTLFNLVGGYKINTLLATNNICKDDHNYKEASFGTLKELDLSSNELENKDFAALCKALCKHQNLRVLRINNNSVNDDTTKHLVTSILQWNNFEIFECEENFFQDNITTTELIQFTIEQMKFHGKAINFDRNINHISYFLVLLECITELTIEQSNFIAQISKVTGLSLDCSHRSKQSIPLILNIKASQSFELFYNLVTLNLSGINISDDAADGLALAFGSNLLFLQNLLMNGCNLNSEIVIKFMNSLKNAKHISTIDMGNNRIDNEATEALVVAVLHWNLQVIENIKLENNPIDLRMFQFVNSLVVENFEDLSIDFSDNIENVLNFVTLLEYMNNVSSDASTFVKILTKIDTLNLNCLQENSTDDDRVVLTIEMSEFLKRFYNLTTLNISGIVIDNNSVDVLSDAFAAHLRMLQHLVMNGCGLDSKSTIKLVQKLHHIKNFKEIQLCDNFIDDKATEELIIAILHWNSLEVIKVENNQFNDESILAIQFLLSCLNDNNLFNKRMLSVDGKDLRSFVTLLHCMNKVETDNSNFISLFINIEEMFILSDRAHDKRRAEFTVDGSAFFQRFVSLRILFIHCITINESSADMFVAAFGNNLSSLKQLDMCNCCITSKIAVNFLQQLQKNRNIEVLNLSNNLIDDEATEAIVVATFHWENFPYLSSNKFSIVTEELFKVLTLICFKSTYYQNSNLFISILEYAKGVPIFDSSVLDKISKLQNLTLVYSKQKHGKQLELTVNASAFFLRFVNLTNLTIIAIKIPKSSMDVLAEAFASNLLQYLKELTLINCGITTETAIILMNKLRNTVNLEKLELSDNHIGDDATNVIATAIFCWHSLININLDYNQFSIKSIKLFQFITEHFLHFSNLSIDFSADLNKVNLLITLLDYASDRSLECISKVECLCLDCIGKRVTDKPLELTVNAAKYFQKFTDLVKLNLSGIIVNKQAANILAIAFSSNLRTLKYLLMNGCNLSSSIVKKFLKELQNAKNIKEIQLCDNLINKSAFEAIAISILNWDSLEIIKLDNNKFHCPEIHSLFLILMGKESHFLTSLENVMDTSWRDFYITKTFISVLEYANHHTGKRVSHFTNTISKLTTLNLNSTCIDKPFDDINLELPINAAKFFSNFTNITRLDLSGIIISEETANVLCRVFDFSKLQSLQLNNCKLTARCTVEVLDKLKHANIQLFEIKNNCIDDDVTKALIIAVLHWSILYTIAFQGNPFSHKFHGLFQFVTNFLKCTQKALPFSCNLDDTSSFITLLECIKEVSIEHSTFLKNISIAKDLYFYYSDKIYFCINYSDVHGEPILHLNEVTKNTQLELSSDASEIFQRFVNLIKLSIIGIKMNENIADNLVTAFGKNIETLQCITLNHCTINSEIASRFASELQRAKNITEIQLCNNLIDDEATTAIVIAMLHWNPLSIMKIDNNRFSNKSMNLFAFVSKKYFMWYPDT